MAKRLVPSTDALALESDGKLRVESLDASSGVYTDASKDLTATPPTSGTLGYWDRTGTDLSPATAGDDISLPDNDVVKFGTGDDMDIGYDGTNGFIHTDLVAASDLNIDCGTSKTLELQTSVWDDIFLPIAITKPGGTAPSWTGFFGNLSQYTFAINDYVEGSFELKHNYKEGTDLDVHVHVVTQGAEAGVEVRYSFEYWIADIGEASAGTTTITSDDYTLTNANGHHEYIDIGDISGAGYKIGAVVCFLFKRVALVGGSDPSSDPFVVSIGAHYEIDTMGSRQETVK